MNELQEKEVLRALKEYADSINGFYELYVDYRENLSEWIVKQYKDWNGKGSFRDVVSEEIFNWEIDSEYYVLDDIKSEIYSRMNFNSDDIDDDDFKEEFGDEIDEIISDNRYEYFSIGYDWNDFPCNVTLHKRVDTEYINDDRIARSQFFFDYIEKEYSRDLACFIAYRAEETQYIFKEISGLDEIIDFIDSEDFNDSDFSFEEDNNYYTMDDENDIDTISEICKKFNNGCFFFDADSLELKEFDGYEDIITKIKIPFCRTFLDDETVAIEDKNGFVYHLDYEEICKFLSLDKKHRKEVLADIFSALQKRKMENLNIHSLNLEKIWISFSDSLNSGNCRFGTDEFCREHNIDTNTIGGIRADFLLEMENSSFTKRAVKYKYLQQTA